MRPPRRSGEARPVGAFGPQGGWHQQCRFTGDAGAFGAEQRRACRGRPASGPCRPVADMAVDMRCAHRSGRVFVASARVLMLVGMMAQMGCRWCLLVAAVRRSRSPQGLQRQQHQQQNGQPTTHRGDCMCFAVAATGADRAGRGRGDAGYARSQEGGFDQAIREPLQSAHLSWRIRLAPFRTTRPTTKPTTRSG